MPSNNHSLFLSRHKSNELRHNKTVKKSQLIHLKAYKDKNGPASPYLMALVDSYLEPRTAQLNLPFLKIHGRQASRLFSVLSLYKALS